MNKKKKLVTLAVIGAMLISVPGCEKKTEREKSFQAVKEKIEQNKKKNQGSNPADYTLPTIRPDVLPTSKPTASAKPTYSARPTYSAKPTYTMKSVQTNVPSKTVKPAQTSKPAYTVKPAQTSKPSTGTRLPLDTTGNFTGLELERTANRNDHIGYQIDKSTTNKVSQMTGTEPQLEVAVDAFNEFKSKNDKFVAYKVIEFDTYSDSDIAKMNKAVSGDKGVEFWRITMNIYQYKQSSYGSPYTNTSDEPYYFIVSIYKTANGQYKRFSSMSSR